MHERMNNKTAEIENSGLIFLARIDLNSTAREASFVMQISIRSTILGSLFSTASLTLAHVARNRSGVSKSLQGARVDQKQHEYLQTAMGCNVRHPRQMRQRMVSLHEQLQVTALVPVSLDDYAWSPMRGSHRHWKRSGFTTNSQ